ncbi:MAG TPA: hypothetical protein VHE30_16075 [Polyangiaceae bacterium]|nr:hypothetical protein [Polyangiaceae bacterium]
MPAALTIVLVLVSGSPSDDGGRADAFTPAIVKATRAALGPGTRIVVKTEETMPADADAVRLGADAHADAVVEVAWTEPEHLRSTIRVQRPSASRWVERDLGFRAIDDPVERSRTVALTIVSMLPEYEGRAVESPPSEPANRNGRPPPEGKGTPNGEGAPNRAGRKPSPGAGRSSDERSEERVEPEPADVRVDRREGRPARHRTAVTAFGAMGLGSGDGGESGGGGVDFRQALGSFLTVRVGASARFGLESPGDVSARHYASALGMAIVPVSSEDGRASLDVRVDGLVALEDFALSRDGGTEHLHKLMPGADAVLEGSYYFVRGAALVLGGGAEALFGRTEIFSGGRRVATLKPVRPVLELGIRFGF